MVAENAKRFEAVLERDPLGLGWTIARVPFDPATVWPEKIRLRVCGEVNGQPFRSSLFRDPREMAPSAHENHSGSGGFFLLVNRATLRAAEARLGELAEIVLRPDLGERPAELPEELDALLDEAEGLRAWYGTLSESTRREIGKWVFGVKTPEARLRRAGAMAERLLSTMEAESELPPVLERAFRAQPKARAGWNAMTAAQRRMQLLAVFYYRTPDARERRVAKVCQAAMAHVE